MGAKESYIYNKKGQLLIVRTAEKGITTYTYDALNRMTGVTGPDGKTTRYQYDEDGNMTKTLREDGETTILYDRQGQITALANTKDGQTISVYAYAYDSGGNITREKTKILKEGNLAETDTLYIYDEKSQLIKAVQTEKGQNPATTTYTYDPAGNCLEMQTEKDGQTLTVTYTYDKEGKLTKTEDSDGRAAVYEYDKAGNFVTETAGPYVESAAAWVEQKKCEAYNYCKNKLEEIITGLNIPLIVPNITALNFMNLLNYTSNISNSVIEENSKINQKILIDNGSSIYTPGRMIEN